MLFLVLPQANVLLEMFLGLMGAPNFAGFSEGSKKFDVCSDSSTHATAGVLNGNIGLPDGPVSALSKKSSVAELETTGVRGSAAVATADAVAVFKKLADPVSWCVADATAGRSCSAHATAGESDSTIGFCCLF